MAREHFTATDVLVLAGGLEKRGGLNAETIRRTNIAAEFVLSKGQKIGKIIVSGGYPLGHEAPDRAGREGPLMAKHLKEVWDIEGVRVEAESRTTVENFAETIRAGHLVPGKYAEEKRALAIVTNRLHAKRAGLIARVALNIADESVFRVAGPERNATAKQIRHERELAQLTTIAIDLACQSNPKLPVDLSQVNHELEARSPEQWKEALKVLHNEQPDWELPDLPMLSYK